MWSAIANATLHTASAASVAIETGDMRQLPFADGQFDLVMSSMAIHNLSSSADRARAVTEWAVGRLTSATIWIARGPK